MDEMSAFNEPKWVLDRRGSGKGQLFWRRDGVNQCRVKFRFDVDVLEFRRQEYEIFESGHGLANLQLLSQDGGDRITLGLTCLMCVVVTVLLPWYIIIGP